MPVLPRDRSQRRAPERRAGGPRPGNRLRAVPWTGRQSSELAVHACSPTRDRESGRAPSGEARLGLCGQCHGFHQESPLPRDDPFWIRFQVDHPGVESLLQVPAMARSTASPATTRITMPNTGRSFYEQKCLACHSKDSTGVRVIARHREDRRPATFAIIAGPPSRAARSACPVNPTRGCLPCHMPAYRANRCMPFSRIITFAFTPEPTRPPR